MEHMIEERVRPGVIGDHKGHGAVAIVGGCGPGESPHLKRRSEGVQDRVFESRRAAVRDISDALAMPAVELRAQFGSPRPPLHFLGLGIVRSIMPMPRASPKHPGPEEIPVGLEGQALGIDIAERIPLDIEVQVHPTPPLKRFEAPYARTPMPR